MYKKYISRTANTSSPKGRINFENLEFLKKEMEEAQKGLNKQNYLYYR